MEKRSSIAFYTWLIATPAAAGVVAFKLSQPGYNYGGYLLPFIAIGVAAALLVLALIVGALTRTIGASIGGTLVGGFATVAVVSLMLG